MKFTESIDELEDLISEYENDVKTEYCGDYRIDPEGLKWRKEAIVNMACAINVLKNNET
jgi:hypothetical protein